MGHVIFFQGGGGEEDHNADADMVASLKSELGPKYSIRYPLLPNEDGPDFGRRKQIGREISESQQGVLLVAHSLGASMLLTYLSETDIKKKIAGMFLIATPFWSGEEDWAKAFKLPSDFSERLKKEIPLFFYHSRDDEEVPYAQFLIYQEKLPWASFREIPKGGHQLGNDLGIVARDISSVVY